ncbi:MAG: serine hydrolase [Candidatus Campbellbacteria bacterium]|nr:serine hydrolase [Candidatus Campbellbacteria bacterium]
MKKFLDNYKKLLYRHRTMTVFATLTVVAFVVLVSSVFVNNMQKQKAAVIENDKDLVEENEQKMQSQILANREEREREEVFSDLELEAEGIYVYDLNNEEVLFEKNPETPMPIASITKVMTIATAQDILSEDDVVMIGRDALDVEGDSNLRLGEKWSFREISDVALVSSSNDAAFAIAKTAGEYVKVSEDLEKESLDIFIDKVNEKAEELGLENAEFYNVTGLDLNNETKAGALASPKDISKLFSHMVLESSDTMFSTRYTDLSVSSQSGRTLEVANTNDAVSSLTGLLASKTGYTKQAGGNLAVAVDAGFMRPVVIVVLGSTYEGRFSDVEKLLQTTKEYYKNI